MATSVPLPPVAFAFEQPEIVLVVLAWPSLVVVDVALVQTAPGRAGWCRERHADERCHGDTDGEETELAELTHE